MDETKDEIKKKINIYDESTFIPILQKLDYPYIRHEWIRLVKRYDDNTVIGRYISKMRLFGYRQYSWKDSVMINNAYKPMDN